MRELEDPLKTDGAVDGPSASEWKKIVSGIERGKLATAKRRRKETEEGCYILLFWSTFSLIGAVLFTYYAPPFVSSDQDLLANFAFVAEAGTVDRVLSVIVGTFLGTMGAIIGTVLRNIARPSNIIVCGNDCFDYFFKILSIRFFWWIGPQLLFFSVGVFSGTVGMLKIMSLSQW